MMYVMSDGPYGKQNREGDEVPEWYVTLYDGDDEVKTWYCDTYNEALDCGEEVADELGIEHIAEGMEA